MSKLTTFIAKIKKDKFAQDSFWAILGNVIGKGMTMLGAIIVARFLGKEIFGEYGTIRTTIINVAMFSTFGLGYTATKYFAEFKKSKPESLRALFRKVILITLKFSGLMAVLLFLSADYISEVILKARHLSIPLRLVSVWIVFNALTTTQIGVLSGLGAFKSMARINSYVGIFAFSSSVLLTYILGLNGALCALLLTQVLNWFLNFKEVNRLLPNCQNQLGKSVTNQILRFSLPVALHEGLYALTGWIILLLLIRFGGYGEVGLYSAAEQWSAIILFVPAILRNVILTHLSEHTNNESEHRKVLKRTLLINLLSTILPSLIIWIALPLIFAIYGPSFQGLKDVLLVLIASTIFISLNSVYSQAFMSKGKNWIMFGIRFIQDLMVIGLFIAISKRFKEGAIGLAYSILLMNALFTLVISLLYNRLTKNAG